MDEGLVTFLNGVGLETEYLNYFEDAKLEKAIYIKKDKKYNIYIKFSSLPKVQTYFAIEQIQNNFKFDSKVIISFDKYIEIDEEYVNSVFQNVILEKHKDSAMVRSIRNIKIGVNQEQILFHFNSIVLRDSFMEFEKVFEDIYHQLGINRMVSFVVIEKDFEEENAKLEAENNNIIKQVSQRAVNRVRDEPKAKVNYYKTQSEQVKIGQLSQDDKNVIVRGKIFDIETSDRKILIVTLFITDFDDAVSVKLFEGRHFKREELESFKEGQWVEVKGDMEYDTYAREIVLMGKSVSKIEVDDEIKDLADEKRVELHTHTKMSNMDGVATAREYIEQASKWGHKAIAITDHGVVQSYPEAMKAAKGKDIKVIYGLEAYVVDEPNKIVMKPTDTNVDDAIYTVFDLETTGLSSRIDEIIEIGAVKVQNGMILEKFQTFINPGRSLSSKITEITSITDDMLKDAPTLDEVLKDFLDFISGTILVAHNAYFDMSFLKEAIARHGLPKLENPVIDTLPLSRYLYKDARAHNLGSVSRRFNIEYDEEIAHRADYDATVLFNVFEVMLREVIDNHNVKTLNDLSKLVHEDSYKRTRPIHMVLLAKNEQGIKDLYKLVSISSTDYFWDIPRIPRKLLSEHRENLLIGSACFNGDVFDTAMTKSEPELLDAVDYYDYIEVQPLSNYSYLVDTGSIENEETLKTIINFIIDAAKAKEKPVVATSDAHYLNHRDKIFRDVYISAQAIGGKRHPLYDFRKRVKENPNQHLRTTTQMLEEFSFLDERLAYEIVVKNSNLIADKIEKVQPLKDGTFTPKIDGAEEKLKQLCYDTAHKLYGEELPTIVSERIDKELTSIIDNGFAVIYYISHKLVEKSVSDGYLVGSRGSVGSSLVAFLTGITEVNSLQPHYRCEHCSYSDFSNEEGVHSGYDLPAKDCPKCGKPLKGDGQSIPFETFLGFKGDKVPDIDLNFSGDYQAIAHDYTKVLFGEDYVYRAGTIGTVAEKTAYGYIKGYFEELGIYEGISKAKTRYLVKGCQGVKRTTGQHPGGIIVIPDDNDVYDFTPIQYPADDLGSPWLTTHFDFRAIEDNVLKLDILGHVDPTALKMLKDMTGIDPKDIPCNDEKVLSLFTSTKALNVEPSAILNETGATGIPEFGTEFVKGMLRDAKPKTFAELVQISGLSHGTDVWNGNAQTLIQNKTCTLMETIGCRDDIMGYLIDKGLDNSLSFKIMESVRKGRGLSPEQEEEMNNKNVPKWYIESCKKIKYMFPKAHAVAYVTMALRVAWFKVYRPLEYYATYFSTRADAFDIDTMIKGYESIKSKYLELESRIKSKDPLITNKDVAVASCLENALEMTARGYKFSNINLYKSQAKNFIVDQETRTIIPPFSSIDGLGASAASSVVEARGEREFISIEDLTSRTQLNNTNIKALEKLGVLANLQATNQLELQLF
ncbi:TPA: PolC-type DNA polymerase III [bacterium]|nr:PolC-type DNA polymerase III [bacterium]